MSVASPAQCATEQDTATLSSAEVAPDPVIVPSSLDSLLLPTPLKDIEVRRDRGLAVFAELVEASSC